jgi:branched-chain amino acid transport system ATP-binding protein
MTAVLSARGLCKRFGDFPANEGVSLELQPGARHALIGPNGAGKTTFVNLLTGVLSPDAGDVFLGARRVTRLPQHERVRHGLSRTFQINSLFSSLTVMESVLLVVYQREGHGGCLHRRWSGFAAEQREAALLLEQLHLADAAHSVTRELPYGKQRLLEIALGLATRPKILLLDEPASGIPKAESREIFEVLASLPRDVAVMFIEHDMDLVFRFAERISVLVSGRLMTEGTPQEIEVDPRVREVYLGEAVS